MVHICYVRSTSTSVSGINPTRWRFVVFDYFATPSTPGQSDSSMCRCTHIWIFDAVWKLSDANYVFSLMCDRRFAMTVWHGSRRHGIALMFRTSQNEQTNKPNLSHPPSWCRTKSADANSRLSLLARPFVHISLYHWTTAYAASASIYPTYAAAPSYIK